MKRKRKRSTQLDLSLRFIAQARQLSPDTQKSLLETMQAPQVAPQPERQFWLVLPTGGKIKL